MSLVIYVEDFGSNFRAIMGYFEDILRTLSMFEAAKNTVAHSIRTIEQFCNNFNQFWVF